MADKYVAYVSCYTRGNKDGIKIYDVDMKNGTFSEKATVQITNSSYMTISHNRKNLYLHIVKDHEFVVIADCGR